jgi:integral membrane sensor domain MASE1
MGWYVLVGTVMHLATNWPHWGLSWVLQADVANIARALCAAVLLRRAFGGRPRLDGIGALMLFVAIAVVAAPAVGATLGAANVVLHGASPTYWRPWKAWFFSNALTGLAMLPALLLVFTNAARGRRPPVPARRLAEALLLAVALAATCAIAFLPPKGGGWYSALPFYAPLPVLIWAALRFGSGGASLALTAVAIAAIAAGDRGTGPFRTSSLDENVLTLQMFVLLTTLPVLCIAAVDSARQEVLQLYHAPWPPCTTTWPSSTRGVALRQRLLAAIRFGGGRTSPARAGPADDYLAACRSAATRGRGRGARAGRLDERAPPGPAALRAEFDRDGGSPRTPSPWKRSKAVRPGAVVTRTDVTARRQAQLEIEEQRRELSASRGRRCWASSGRSPTS